MVRSGADLYVRSWRGHEGAWFRSAQETHEGHIGAGEVEKDVIFVDVDADDAVNDALDTAYRMKYRRYGRYVPPMISPEARAATLRIVPHAPQ